MKALNDTFEYELENGETIKGRILNLGDIAQLSQEFPEWDTDDLRDLLDNPKCRWRAISRITVLGLSGQNPDLPDSDILRLFNVRDIEKYQGLWYKILDFDMDGIDAEGDAGKN